MANKVVVSPQADRDIDAIWVYIAARNIVAANALIDRVASTSQILADAQLAGRARPELREELRSFPVSNYVIFYRPISSGIEVVRILHGRQDISADDMD